MEGGGTADWGRMKNDPVDGIMQRNDFSSTIICLVWIAAAVATLHLMVCRTKEKKNYNKWWSRKRKRLERHPVGVFVLRTHGSCTDQFMFRWIIGLECGRGEKEVSGESLDFEAPSRLNLINKRQQPLFLMSHSWSLWTFSPSTCLTQAAWRSPSPPLESEWLLFLQLRPQSVIRKTQHSEGARPWPL